jgi:hypothetical protein
MGRTNCIISFDDDDDDNNSVALVRERPILIERQPFVGEVSANFCT